MENERLIADSKNQDMVDHSDPHIQMNKSWTFFANIAFVVILLAVSIQILHKECYTKALFDTVSTVSLFIIVFCVTEICLRIFHFFVEIFQIKTKYGGEVVKVIESLNLSTLTWIVLAFSSVTFLILHISASNTFDHIWSLGPRGWIPAFICSVIVCQLIGLRESKLNTMELISRMGGVDYGTGMAYSYFYGYLKIILPADGSNKGLRFKMEQYEAEQNVTIPVKKLFILIPKSGHIPTDLREASDNWLESTTRLENEVRDRAGVKSRSYSNTVYKIHPGGDGKNHPPVYVTTEGATPMLTLWEILGHDHPQTAAYREHKIQIVEAFYTTLQMLLDNDPRCTNVCELVFYDDYDAKRKLRNVGEILLKRIKQQATQSV